MKEGENEGPIASTSYFRPAKRILSPAHLAAFQRSQSHKDILAFVDVLNDSVDGVRLTQAGLASKRTQPLVDILDAVLDIARATPPVDNKLSRFGNPAFKDFYDRVTEASDELHRRIPHLPHDAIPELTVYFCESWGNRQRVDYGSGMELNFVCWLLCLETLGLLQEEDRTFMVLGVFWKYIQTMRYLQSTYWLEPAGSHGVWGLDDYQFLPFLWGAGQLKNHKHLRPKSIHDPEILEEFSKDYMYLSCISFINSIKIKTWDKVNSGMRKMFAAEVLGKLPVMQHAMFGSLIPFPTPEEDPELAKALEEDGVLEPDAHGHIHAKGTTGWTMDCCGIPVPSAFAQAQATKGQTIPLTSRSGIKPIPFD